MLPELQAVDGLQNLSKLLLSAFAERQDSKGVTSVTSFKPPPRVTLTDARKTAWFADLANPFVPLRRLSRTIPHGIRGKVLLDQCSLHRVPVSRAIWLAKCVGANELRAFKRKGVSGRIASANESKWIQDWTTQVLDFLWETVARRTELEELSNGLQLVSCMFAEHLLENDLFLDSLLQRYSACDLDDLPMIVGVISTWLEDFLVSFPHTYKLAWASFALVQRATHPPISHELRATVSRIDGIVRVVLDRSPSAYCCPFSWNKNVPDFLQRACGSRNNSSAITIRNIENKSKTTRSYVHRTCPESTNSVEELASSLDNYVDEDITATLQELVDSMNQNTCINTIIKWASTAFRAECGASYIAAGLLKRMAGRTPSCPASILFSMFEHASAKCASASRLGRLGARLAQVGLLDAKAYCHQLITSGDMYTKGGNSNRLTCHASILQSFSYKSLSSHVAGLRAQLLKRLGKSSLEDPNLTQARSGSTHLFPSCPPELSVRFPNEGFRSYLGTCNTHISAVVERIRNSLQHHADDNSILSSMSLQDAKIICNILEECDNPELLSPVLIPMIRACHYDILTQFACLIKSFEAALAFIQERENITGLLLSRYRAIRQREAPHGELVASLLLLNWKEDWVLGYLQNEIRLFEQSQAVIANTPASEGATPAACSTSIGNESFAKTAKCVHVILGRDYCSGSVACSKVNLETISHDSAALLQFLTTDSERNYLARLSTQETLTVLRFGLTSLKDSEEDAFTKVKDVCRCNKLRELVINVIIHQEQLAYHWLDSLLQADLCTMSRLCVEELLCSLILPLKTNNRASTRSENTYPSCPEMLGAIIELVSILTDTDEQFAKSIISFVLYFFVHDFMKYYPQNTDKLRTELLSHIRQTMKSCPGLSLAAILRSLPRSLNTTLHIVEDAEEALIDRIEATNTPNEEGIFTSLSISELLEMVKTTKTTPRRNSASRLQASRIGTALMNCTSGKTETASEKLIACLSLALLCHEYFTQEADQIRLLTQLCLIIADEGVSRDSETETLAYYTAAAFIPHVAQSVLKATVDSLPESALEHRQVNFLLGYRPNPAVLSLQTRFSNTDATSSALQTLAAFNLASDDPTEPLPQRFPFEVKPWEILSDSSSKQGENDAPLGLRLFDATKHD